MPLLRCFLLGILLLSGGNSFGQGTMYKRKYMEFYDDKTVHYGFFFALPNTRFSVKRSQGFLANDSTIALNSPLTQGFRMGFLVNVYLSKRFDFRVSPLSVSIYGRAVDFDFTNSTQRQIRESTWVEFPMMLRYKSERRMNSRMYLLAGCRFGIESNVRRNGDRLRNKGVLAVNSTDFALEYGVGFEQFFEYFKFTPELHFSHGVVNMLKPNDTAFTNSLQRINSHTVTLYLTFE